MIETQYTDASQICVIDAPFIFKFTQTMIQAMLLCSEVSYCHFKSHRKQKCVSSQFDTLIQYVHFKC